MENGKPKRILVEDHGKIEFELGQGGPVLLIDTLAVSDSWGEVYRAFQKPDGTTDAESWKSINDKALEFVRELYRMHAVDRPDAAKIIDFADRMSVGGACRFLKLVTDEVTVLRPFIEPESLTAPSSRASSTVTFSTEN